MAPELVQCWLLHTAVFGLNQEDRGQARVSLNPEQSKNFLNHHEVVKNQLVL